MKQLIITGTSLQASSRGLIGLALGTLTVIKNALGDCNVSFVAGRLSPKQNTGIPIDSGIEGLQPVTEYLVRARQYPRLLLFALLTKLFPFLKNQLAKSEPILSVFENADAVISISGGDSFSDIYGLRQFLVNYIFDIVTILLRKPLIYFPQTIGPFKSPLARTLAHFTLNRARLVFTREHYSTQTVKKLFPNVQAVEKADVAFLMPAISIDAELPQTTETPLVGLNVSGLLYFDHPSALCALDYPQLMQEIVQMLIVKHHANVLLIPHDYGEGFANDDLEACKAVLDHADPQLRRHLSLIEKNYDAQRLKTIIGKCDFFIGSRLHACIAALSMRVPINALAYSYKFLGIMAKVGVEKFACNLRSGKIAELVETISDTYENRLQIRHELESNVLMVEEAVQSCGAILKSSI